VSGLLPHLVRHAVSGRSVSVTSQSFGVVTFILLIMLMVERETLRVAWVKRGRQVALTVVAAPLLVVVALTIVARLALLVH
jgi:hypothetical protein